MAFFDFYEWNIMIFTLLTLLALPSLFVFYSYSTEAHGTYFFSKLELGNMGFASALCEDVPLGVGRISVSCPTGIIQETISFGIVPHLAKTMDACMPNEETQRCNYLYDEKQVQNLITKSCFSESTCSFDVNEFLKLKGGKEDNHCRNDFA